MTLRDLGVAYDSAVATFYMNAAISPLIQDVVLTQLDRIQPHDKEADATNNHRINNARSAFIIYEAFVLDVQWHDTTSTLKQYDGLRGKLGIAERWQLFILIVTHTDTDILFEAFNNTRAKVVLEPETDSKKKSKSSTT